MIFRMLFLGRLFVFVCIAHKHLRFESNTNGSYLRVEYTDSETSAQNVNLIKGANLLEGSAANLTSSNVSREYELEGF